MIVCSCNVFSDRQVLDALAQSNGIRTPSEVYRGLGCSPQCGRCARTIRNLMDQAQAHDCGACADDWPGTGVTPMVAAE